MDAKFVSLGRQRVLACRPRSKVFGLLVADVIIAFHIAKTAGAALLLLSDGPEASGLLRLQVSGVARIDPRGARARAVRVVWAVSSGFDEVTRLCRVVHSRTLDVLAGAIWVSALCAREAAAFLAEVPSELRLFYNRVIRAAQSGWQRACRSPVVIGRRVSRKSARPRGESVLMRLEEAGGGWLEQRLLPKVRARPARDRVTLGGRMILDAVEQRRLQPWRKDEVHRGYDIRKLAATQHLGARLSAGDEARALKLAARRGLTPGAPIVTLHVREASPESEPARHQARNAKIETYLPAIDELVRRGYRVVRIGDETMTPVSAAGVDDLATSPDRDPLLEFWCIAHSRFFVASDSGPYLLSWLFEVPCLSVNIVNIVGVFPLRQHDLYLVKRLRDTAAGREVPLREMLTEEFIYGLRRRMYKDCTLEYIDNSPEDILDAVREMAARLDRPIPESDCQAEYRELMRGIRASSLSRDKQYGKTGIEEAFLGEGRVADSFASRYLDPVLTM